MSHSIRLRFVDWLESHLHQTIKAIAEVLRGDHSHSHTHGGERLWRSITINHSLPQRQVHDTVSNSVFQDQIDEFNARAGITNGPVVITNPECLSTSNNDFIGHQLNPLSSNIIIGNFNQRQVGGQSARKEQEGAS